MRRVAPLLLSFALALGATPARALKTETYYGPLSGGKSVEVSSGEVFVRLDSAPAREGFSSALTAFGGTLLEPLGTGAWWRVALPAGMPVGAGVAALRGLPGAAAVEPNYAHRALRVPNDPQALSQYALSNVSAYAAWEFEVGSSSLVTVGIIDSGIEGTHPELSGKLTGTSRFCNGSGCAVNDPPSAACDHGTMVAGVAAAESNNGIGVVGMSWGAKLISLKVFADADCSCNVSCTASCQGSCATNDASLIAAINHARTTLNGAAGIGKLVLNMSLGGAGSCGGALQTAISDAFSAGILIVAAAGNDGGDVNTPGNCGNVIPVGMTDSKDAVDSRSSRGAAMASNGVVAPGVNLTTTYVGGDYTGSATGTSFSAPMVSGLAALLWAAQPAWTPTQVKDTIRATTNQIGVSSLATGQAAPLGSVAGAGRIDAYYALLQATRGTSSHFAGRREVVAFPNPFRPSQHGVATIKIPDDVQGRNPEIKIYTQDGRWVRTINGSAWDGKNAEGVPVASGVYVLLVKTEQGSSRGRLAVLR